jgi:hypothetical protein
LGWSLGDDLEVMRNKEAEPATASLTTLSGNYIPAWRLARDSNGCQRIAGISIS